MKTQLVSSSGSHVGGKGVYTVVACTISVASLLIMVT